MKTNIHLTRWDGIFGKVDVLCIELFTGMSLPLELLTMQVKHYSKMSIKFYFMLKLSKNALRPK
jgi:hypothetical protein